MNIKTPDPKNVRNQDLLVVGGKSLLGGELLKIPSRIVAENDFELGEGDLSCRLALLVEPSASLLRQLSSLWEASSPIIIIASDSLQSGPLSQAVYMPLRELKRPGFATLVRALIRDKKEKQAHEVLARISHDMRAPMSVIKTACQLLQRNSESPAKVEDFASMIASGSKQLQALIEDILDFSRLDQGRCELNITAFNLPHLLGDVAESTRLLAFDKELNVEMSLESKLPKVVQGDPGRLRQILGNLLSNAVKFTEKGSVRLDAWHSGDDCYFKVTDTGVGIPEESLEKIFQPYQQADSSVSGQYGGTGLGLNICKLLIANIGGEISVKSELGRGTEFSVKLKMPTAKHSRTSHEPVVWNELEIWHNDIEIQGSWRQNAEIIGTDLKSIPKDYRTGVSSSSKRPDVIIFDLQKGGFLELARLIRPFGENPPTLVTVTNSGQRGDAARCKKLGVDVYLTAPFSFLDLQELIRRALQDGSNELLTRHTLKEARLRA